MRDVLLVVMVSTCALVALRRPVFGLLAFICFGLVNPQSFTWGFGRFFPLAQITALGTIIGFMVSGESNRLPRQREMYFLVALWGFFCISTFFAMFPDRGIFSEHAWNEWKQISKILLMVLLSMSLINTRERLHWLMRVIALSLGFLGLKGGFFAVISGGNFMVWGPENSFLYANNAIGLALAMNVPVLFYLIKMESYPWLKNVMWLMLVFSFPAVICTFSRGAWLGLAAVTGLIILKTKYKMVLLLGGGLVSLVVLPILFTFLTSDLLPERVVSRFDDLANYDKEASAQSRFWNWELCKRVGLANPLTGEGFKFYRSSMYAKYYPEFQEEWGYEQVWTCHNMWLTVLAEHGIPAFLLWLTLLGSCFLSLRRLRKLGHTMPSLSWVVPYSNMIQSGFVAYAICGTFLDIPYFDLYYQLIAVIVIVKEQVQQQLNEESYVVSRPDEVKGESKTILNATC